MCCILLQRKEICFMSLRNSQLLVGILNMLCSLLVVVNVFLTMKSKQSYTGTETLLHILIVLFSVNAIFAFISWFSRTVEVAVISFILTLILQAIIITTIALLINIFVNDRSVYNNIGLICGFCYGVVGLFTYVAVHCYFRELFDEEVYRNNLGLNV